MGNKKFIFFLILTISAHLFLFFLKNYLPATKTLDGLEQEHFLNYTVSLKSGNFPTGLSYADTRFFPGFPFVILIFSYITGNPAIAGLILTLISLVLIYLISYYFTKSPFYSFWITIFPPIVFEQTSKISTEVLLIASFFLIYLFFVKKKYFYASLLAGFAVIVRPVALFIYLPIFIHLLRKKDLGKLVKSLFFVSIFPLVFVIFNLNFFGDIFYQIKANAQVGEASFSFLQIFIDIYKNILMGNWRIIISGLAYVAFSFFLFYRILRERSDFMFYGDGLFIKLWTVGTFLFVYSVGPLQFLAEIRRFLAVFFPLALVINYRYFRERKKVIIFGLLLMTMALV
jgi:hypothetical protein